MSLRRETGAPIPTNPAGPIPMAAPAAPTGPILLGVPLFLQQQSEWCWAACTAMIAAFFNKPTVKQCELANFLQQQTTCCDNPGSSACNQPCQNQNIMRVYGHIGIGGHAPDLPLFVDTLANEIIAGRPVEVGFLWDSGGGHVVLVYGYNFEGVFAVRDPWRGTLSVTYPALQTAYGMGEWVVSYGRFTGA